MRACVLMAALAIGCASPSGTFVEFADPDIPEYVELGVPALERLQETNYLKVTVPIRNRSSEQVQLLVEVEFRDSNQQPYGDVTPSRLMVIPRGSTRNFTATSLKPVAMDYKVRMRWYR